MNWQSHQPTFTAMNSACNGWFITFSRMAINNILVVLYAMTVAALLSPAFEGSTGIRRIGARLLIGIVLSLATFSYFSGRILVLTTLAFLLLSVGAKVCRSGWKACAWTLAISASVYAAVSGAILLSYRKQGVNWLHMTMDRPQAVCWLCKAVQGSQRDFKWYWGSDSLSDALLLQARKIFRGYVLAQPVTSGGFENARYRPNDTALLNVPVGLLYTVGPLLLVLKAFKRDWASIPLHIKFFALLFVVHITIVAIPTDFSPNWARLVATIPFFFFVAAYGADRAL